MLQHWDNVNNRAQSFVPTFKEEFCSPFKLSQWKHQLRNRKQKPGETIEEYVAAITELWKRIDPDNNRTELDRIHEFIEGLRPEFIVPVQSAMPATVNEAIEKARAVETAFSIRMELSAYSMLPGYLNNGMGGMTLPAKANMALYQPIYTASRSQEESIEQLLDRKLKEGIAAAVSQLQLGSNQRQQNNQVKCFNCNKIGHIARDCRSKRNNNNGNNNGSKRENNNSNRSNDIECFTCGKKGHIARNCRNKQRYGNRDNESRGSQQSLN